MSDHPRGGLEQALTRAAADLGFRARLLADRSRAALQEGIALSDAERAILDSLPATQLEVMIPELPSVPWQPPPPDLTASMGIRPDEIGIVRGHSSRVALIALGTAVAAGAAIGVGVCRTHGHTAEVPPPRIEERTPPAPQDRPDAGTIDQGDKGADPKR
jgi:hypothetical protein